MNRIIFKFPIPTHKKTMQLPVGPIKVLDVQIQDNQMTLWVELNDPGLDQPAQLVDYQVLVVGTGWSFNPGDLVHRGTVQDTQGLVWHVYLEDKGLDRAAWQGRISK